MINHNRVVHIPNCQLNITQKKGFCMGKLNVDGTEMQMC